MRPFAHASSCTSYVALCNAQLCRRRMCSMIVMSGSYLPDWDFNKFDKCQSLIFNQTEYRWIFANTAESIWIQAQLCLRLKVCWTGEKARQARAYLHPISLLDFQQLWLGKWRVGNPNRNLGSKKKTWHVDAHIIKGMCKRREDNRVMIWGHSHTHWL